MKTRTKLLLSLAAASAVLAGCSAMHMMGGGGGPGMKSITCTSAPCTVYVDVDNCTITDPGTLHVRPHGAVPIHWKLTSANHDFTGAGITFQSGAPFNCPGKGGKGEFVCIDTYTTAGGPYKYTIQVIKDGAPSSCQPLDPDVVNE